MVEMLPHLLLLVFSTLFALCLSVEVHLPDTGTIRGFETSTDVRKFLGIPYAQPPVGSLRFASSRPPSPWHGIMDATRLPFSCPQQEISPFPKLYNTERSEDCLYLNVYQPRRANGLAVMVWFHGGSYTEGTASTYDPSPLVEFGNVVVVTANYRLNVLGFMQVYEGDTCKGIEDQQLVLKWVQRNIHLFGGDRDRVTIFGESAGSESVGHHVFSPASMGLFKRAIMQSGAVNAKYATHDSRRAQTLAATVIEGVNCTTANTTELLSCLRSKNLAEFEPYFNVPFAPAIDGHIISHNAVELSEPLISPEIDVMIGFTSSDGFSSLLFSEDDSVADLTNNFTDLSYLRNRNNFANQVAIALGNEDARVNAANGSSVHLAVTREYEDALPSDGKEHFTLFALDRLYTDLFFRLGGVMLANKLATDGTGNVYFYQYSHSHADDLLGPPKHLYRGAGHGAELYSLFDPELDGNPVGESFLGRTKLEAGNPDPDDVSVRRRVIEYWTSFAKSGNPGPPFELYRPSDRNFVDIDRSVIRHQCCFMDSYDFWDTLLSQTTGGIS